MKKLLIAMAVTLGPVAGMLGTGEASAASTAELWASRYNGPADSYDRAVDVAASPDGTTVFVIGQSFGPPRVSYYETIAYSALSGAQLWARRYTAGGIGHDAPSDVAVSPDGTRVFVTGGTARETSGSDATTIAYTASTGDRLWARRYIGPTNGGAGGSALTVSSDGSMVFITGSISFGATDDSNYLTVAYDAATGAKRWVSRYDGPDGGDSNNDFASSIAVSPEGNRVFVTGGSYGGPTGSSYATIAYDATTGTRLWTKRYEFKTFDNVNSARAIAVSPDGETVFVTGLSAGEDTNWDYATIAYDAASGATTWEKRYNGPPRDEQDAANALALSPDGSMVFVTGESQGLAGDYDYATVAYDAVTGRRQWVTRYNEPENGGDYAKSIAVSPDGSSVFVTGGSGDFSAQGDYATLAYDAGTGAKRWVERYNGPSNEWDRAMSVAVSPDGTKVFVTGASFNAAGYDDFATIAYAS
jgi:DNA-binding beta-propeller fold protein YncE